MNLNELRERHSVGDRLEDQFGNIYEITRIDYYDVDLPVEVELIETSQQYLNMEKYWDLDLDTFRPHPNCAGRRDWIFANINAMDPEDRVNISPDDYKLVITLESMKSAYEATEPVNTVLGDDSETAPKHTSLQQASANLLQAAADLRWHGWNVEFKLTPRG